MDQSYFDKIPIWAVGGARFEVMADDLSGRIPVTRIEKWQDFSTMLESNFFNMPGEQQIFRGHRRYDWNLLPSLGRLAKNGIVSDDLADKQLELFRQAVRGRLKDSSLLIDANQEDELWSIGQHHGLMTPLLDWTHSPYVALFFAFAKEDQQSEEENHYRSIYVLNKTFVANNGVDSDIRVLEPRKDDHGRLVNQAGLFTFSPTDATIENKLIEIISEFDEYKEADEEAAEEIFAHYICKIYIRNEDREGCLKSLRRMNVHHASLFPDLLGASDYCNLVMEEDYREQSIAEAAIRLEVAPSVIETSSDTVTLVVTTPEPTLEEGEESNLVELLKTPAESAQVEPGRIQLIASQLAKELKKHRVVDWDKRGDAQARLRNIARVTLRKMGYPQSVREEIVEKIIEVAVSEFKET